MTPSPPAAGAVGERLAALLEGYVALHRRLRGTLPRQPHDPGWPSPCQAGPPDAEGWIEWRPVERAAPPDFSGLERALEERLHPAVTVYYGRFYCDVVPARITARAGPGGGGDLGTLQLIQVWSDADFARLGENLLGHALGKMRRREPLTVFFATAPDAGDAECFLSVENRSGRVVLEVPGEPPRREVAPSLGALLAGVEPVLEPE